MMSKLFTPTFRISLGLVGLTISLIISAYAFGLIPDERRVELEARGKIAEALAVQLSNAASRNDVTSVQETISSVVKRNNAILSIAIRRSTGKLLITAGDHKQHWVEPHDHRSTPTHVQVTLNNGVKTWGKIEFSFAPLQSSGGIAGIPNTLIAFIVFLSALGFVGYYLLLRRSLRELDPGNVIPERVQAAFNTLAEGVIILDERGLVLLVNDSFSKAINHTSKSLFGREIKDLHWRQWGENPEIGNLPWQMALRDQKQVKAVKLAYRSTSGNFRNFMVNATCILNEKGVASGVIVTFDDVTALERKNDDLILAVKQLEKSEEEISHQNRELQYLANHDPLTGCLNRRAFFEQFAIELEKAHQNNLNFSCLMVDLDHFKNVNDNFGHAVGDDVIAGMAGVLKSNCSDEELVGRYGGEEFCIALIGRSRDENQWFADQIREQVISISPGWLNANQHITTSIGIATLTKEACSVKGIVNWADKALYEAKETGRNKVVFWDQTLESTSSKVNKPPVTGIVKATPQMTATTPQTDPNPVHNIVGTEKDAFSFSPANMQSIVDPLTKLPSQLIIIDRIAQSITRAERSNTKVAVLQISLDSFECYTSAFGSAVSRELIYSVGQRLSAALRQSDAISLFDGGNRMPTLSYLENDRFLVELSDLEETNTITWIVKRLLNSLARPLTIDGEEIYATSNIGVSLYPDDGDDAETLIQHATVAQQHARALDGSNNVQFFSVSMNEHSRQQLKLEAGIRHAQKNNEFSLFFQPIIDATSGRLKSLEALLRCHNPTFSGMPIGMVISIAEQSGLIIEIGEWVTRTAIRQAEQWIASGFELPSISVNLSAIQLGNRQAMERIVQIILEMELPPRKLQFEITETAILKDVETAGVALMRLQQLGVMIALDDFGTGQSSLSYLRRFRPDVLKIDRCFINELTTSHADETLVAAIVVMSQRMGIRVVAEGVETKKQLDKVRDMRCDDIQGFYLARPMPVDATTLWLRSTKRKDIIELAENKPMMSEVA
ncbi:MAG: diguanylate cyclase [bacterium]|nr:diguanylate cyclase [bacterium]